MPATNKILVGGQAAAELRDLVASGAITPGHLVEYVGDTETVQVHSTAAERGLTMFADIVPYSGDPDTAAAPIDDAYADGDYVKCFVADVGNRVNAIAAEAIAFDDKLVSAGDGRLRTLDTAGGDDPSAAQYVARESAAAAGDRVTVERI